MPEEDQPHLVAARHCVRPQPSPSPPVPFESGFLLPANLPPGAVLVHVQILSLSLSQGVPGDAWPLTVCLPAGGFWGSFFFFFFFFLLAVLAVFRLRAMNPMTGALERGYSVGQEENKAGDEQSGELGRRGSPGGGSPELQLLFFLTIQHLNNHYDTALQDLKEQDLNNHYDIKKTLRNRPTC